MGEDPKARLIEFREKIGLDQKGLASAIGVSAPTISRAETGERGVSKKLAHKLAERFSLNPIWLEHGQGEMFLARGEAQPLPEPSADLEDARYVRVARYQVSVSAGNGAVNYDEAPDGYIAFPRSFLSEVGVTGTDCGLVEVTGDSMGYTIRPGALALVDFSVRQFVPSKVFVFRQGDDVRVKRVLPGIGGIALISDNPLYEDEVIADAEAAQLAVIGQVRAVITKV